MIYRLIHPCKDGISLLSNQCTVQCNQWSGIRRVFAAWVSQFHIAILDDFSRISILQCDHAADLNTRVLGVSIRCTSCTLRPPYTMSATSADVSALTCTAVLPCWMNRGIGSIPVTTPTCRPVVFVAWIHPPNMSDVRHWDRLKGLRGYTRFGFPGCSNMFKVFYLDHSTCTGWSRWKDTEYDTQDGGSTEFPAVLLKLQ